MEKIQTMDYAGREAIIESYKREKIKNKFRRRTLKGLVGLAATVSVLTYSGLWDAVGKVVPQASSFYEKFPFRWYGGRDGVIASLATENNFYNAHLYPSINQLNFLLDRFERVEKNKPFPVGDYEKIYENKLPFP